MKTTWFYLDKAKKPKTTTITFQWELKLQFEVVHRSAAPVFSHPPSSLFFQQCTAGDVGLNSKIVEAGMHH